MEFRAEIDIPDGALISGYVLIVNWDPPDSNEEGFTYSTYDGMIRQTAMGLLAEHLDSLLGVGRDFRKDQL